MNSTTEAAPVTRTVSDVLADLDLDAMLDDAVPPPSCEWQGGAAACGAPATWILSLTCGHSAYFDDEHVERIRHTIESSKRTACSNPAPPVHVAMLTVEARFDRIAS